MRRRRGRGRRRRRRRSNSFTLKMETSYFSGTQAPALP